VLLGDTLGAAALAQMIFEAVKLLDERAHMGFARGALAGVGRGKSGLREESYFHAGRGWVSRYCGS
jgi:hypothetical protein